MQCESVRARAPMPAPENDWRSTFSTSRELNFVLAGRLVSLPSRLALRYSAFGRWYTPRCRRRRSSCDNMAASIYLQRNNGFAEKPHLGNGLPTYNAAVREKQHRHHHSVSWLNPISLPIPGVRTRRLRLMIPNFSRLVHSSQVRFGRRRGPFLLFVSFFALLYFVLAVNRRFTGNDNSWTPSLPFPDPSTLVYRREDLQRIWEWEIAAGHYPSGRRSTWNSKRFRCCCLTRLCSTRADRSTEPAS